MADTELQQLIAHQQQNGPVNAPPTLLELLFQNNPHTLNNALNQANEEDFTRKHNHTIGQRNILTIACIDPQISVETFECLFEYVTRNFAHLDFTEQHWYYWEPIHFAAFHTNARKLAVIVKLVGRLNVLSILSENALHVLLEYGQRTESFNVQLSNSWESRICHVLAEERPEVVECARILIQAGIDVNHNNIWNETPLIIAIRYRLLGVIELILEKRDVDLDSCKDKYSDKSARDLLRENEICLKLLTPNTITVPSAKLLFTYLKNGDENMFLRYNNENIRQFVNQTDGQNANHTSSGTMLQLCLIKGYIDYKKSNPNNEDPADTDILKTSILRFFCRNGFGRSIEHLLNNGADVTTRKLGNQDVFQMTVKLSYYPFLTILLEHRSNQITKEHIRDVLNNINRASFEMQNCNTRHVLFLLISKLETFYLETTQDFIDFDMRIVLNKILDFYLDFNGPGDEYQSNICQILRMGASLTGRLYELPENASRLRKISYNTLQLHLDECIKPNNDVCFNSIISDNGNNNGYSETEFLHDLSHDSKKRELLNHPALVYLIYAKWVKSSKFFYLNFILYSLFLLFLYWYMILLQINYQLIKPVFVIFLILLILIVIKEIVQGCKFGLKYFWDVSNYLEFTIIVCCIISLFTKNEIAMIIAILLSSLIFLLMLGQVPTFTKYMIIFSSTKYFLQYALFYFIQFVSFALCFLILLPPEENTNPNALAVLGDIMLKLFDTLIFFIGQYDGDITAPPKFPIFGRVIVAVFIFCMTIILNNLLVGLIVTDMDKIQKFSKEQRQVKMIRYVNRIEEFLKTKMIKTIFGDTKVFSPKEHKIIKDISENLKMFDEDDKERLKEIHDTRLQEKNVLRNLYEYIIGEIYDDKTSVSNNRDILIKLARLEDQLRRGRPR
ncbi:unnamed protein product [Ceutorhynchus assimilis]|uniref:Ion transport domain-containing protein n=1 Tax=Ceutorhynchus assimilis TaxID=467358 RepID=A0A9N9QRT6_9CUCU|nr:unnamed protein product [Ceutorhynchus assimilis]